jgi:hypothetical protein
LEQLKSNPKKWWDYIKGLAGYTKKPQISTSLFNNQICVGKPLADKINDAFSSVTQHSVPLQSSPEFNEPEFVSKFIISEDEVYKKLSCLQPFNRLVLTIYQIGCSNYMHLFLLPLYCSFNL